MSSNNDNITLVSEEIFQQSFSDLNQLQKQLPDDAVIALAREVLDRLAKQVVEPASHSEEIAKLSSALTGPEKAAAPAIVQGYLRNGLDVEQIYLQYLAPASHELGLRWDRDTITFADVTVGTGRIYAIMRSLSRRFNPRHVPSNKSALFAGVPGDDHQLGIKMAVDLARERGWHVDIELGLAHDELVDRLTSSEHLIFGISAGGHHSLPSLAKLILALRVSVPYAQILVSGNAANLDLESIKLMHPDAVTEDFEQAMDHLDSFWEQLQQRLT